MKFRPSVAIASIFLLLGVGIAPQAAFASDSCDPRLEGWTYSSACDEILSIFTRYASPSTDTFSTSQVNVGSSSARVDYHLQLVAPWGFSTIKAVCGNLTSDQSIFSSQPLEFSDQQTVFGLEITGGDTSTLRSYFQADGVTLPFPLQLREFQVAGAEVAFELEGHVVIPKGTKPFEGSCQGFTYGPMQHNGDGSAGADGILPFNVISTTPSANSGSSEQSTPSPSATNDPTKFYGPQLFGSPSPSTSSQTQSGSQTPAVIRFPEAILGSTKMYVNGQEVQLESKKSSETELEAKTEDGISIVISTPNAPSANIGAAKTTALALIRGIASRIRASGFAPNSLISLWLFSTPTKLTEVTSDANGEIDLEFTLPETIEAGDHNLQVSGRHVDGSSRDLVIGVSVVEETLSYQDSPKAELESQDQTEPVAWAAGALLLAGLSVAVAVVGRKVKARKRNPKL
jgi:hypothetical protein